MMAALVKSVVDVGRSDKAGRNARDGFATEHMEIASYQMLELEARKAGDKKKAAVARQNRQEEEAMARSIGSTSEWTDRRALAQGGGHPRLTRTVEESVSAGTAVRMARSVESAEAWELLQRGCRSSANQTRVAKPLAVSSRRAGVHRSPALLSGSFSCGSCCCVPRGSRSRPASGPGQHALADPP